MFPLEVEEKEGLGDCREKGEKCDKERDKINIYYNYLFIINVTEIGRRINKWDEYYKNIIYT